jgi:DNA end-binding protein Ku
MATRAIWAGNLKLGSANLPVKLYSAAQDQAVHFHILEAKTKSRVKQHMVNPDSGEEVASSDIRKAYEVERGVFVVLDDKELASLEPKVSRDIELTRFVPSGHISHLWYERPYYLGPAGNESDYFAFVEALRNQKREGIARWVMRKKAYVGALRVNEDYLALITLKHADEILSERDLPAPRGRGLSAKELKMAEELVKALEGDFNLEDFRDEYRDRVMSFVEAKAKGKKPTLHAVRAKRATTSLADDLAKSLTALKRGTRGKERKVA